MNINLHIKKRTITCVFFLAGVTSLLTQICISSFDPPFNPADLSSALIHQTEPSARSNEYKSYNLLKTIKLIQQNGEILPHFPSVIPLSFHLPMKNSMEDPWKKLILETIKKHEQQAAPAWGKWVSRLQDVYSKSGPQEAIIELERLAESSEFNQTRSWSESQKESSLYFGVRASPMPIVIQEPTLKGSLPLGIRLNNPFDLRPWRSDQKQENNFIRFETMKEGLVAGINNLLYSHNVGRNTVEKLISIYAPPGDNNDTEAYIKNVSTYMGVRRNQSLNLYDPAQLKKLAESILQNEGTSFGVSDSMLNDAIATVFHGLSRDVDSVGISLTKYMLLRDIGIPAKHLRLAIIRPPHSYESQQALILYQPSTNKPVHLLTARPKNRLHREYVAEVELKAASLEWLGNENNAIHLKQLNFFKKTQQNYESI